MIRLAWSMALCSSVIWIAGCSRGDQPTGPKPPTTQASGTTSELNVSSPTDASGDREIVRTVHGGPTRKGRYWVQWKSMPPDVPLNQLFELDVEVFLPDGKTPFEGKVAVDAWMPAHRHGLEDVEPTLESVPGSPGRFHVTGMKLHMPGQWEFRVDVGEGEVWDVGFYPVYAQ